jgi:S1-C subfamily serine protease
MEKRCSSLVLAAVATFAFGLDIAPVFALDSIPEIVAKTKPATIQIITLDENWSRIKTGTGFFISPDGLAVTNFHVIQGASHLSGRTHEGAVFIFEGVVLHPPGADLAILKFAAQGVTCLKLGHSTDAVEGQRILVIGSPEGLQGTVTEGIISAFRDNRSMIQISAPISPGSKRVASHGRIWKRAWRCNIDSQRRSKPWLRDRG